jgi:predicted ATPase
MVFLLEPWETIYKQDEHRLETFEEAKNYFSFIQEIYMERHRVVLVPKSSVSSRVVFIEEYLKNHE